MAKRADPGPPLFDLPTELYRFLLVIRPSKALCDKVSAMKSLLAEHIGSFSGRHSIAHITLFYADLPIECERDLCESIAQGVAGHRSFTLHYNGIKHFPDKRTIYIDPVQKEAIAPVRKRIVRHVRNFPRTKKGIKPTDHPHLTIAAGLKPAQFEKAWEMLEPYAHVSEEQVTEVVLLRRALREGERYVHVRTFALE
jgi:2'-5' RNA ligase